MGNSVSFSRPEMQSQFLPAGSIRLRESAENGIASVQTNCSDDARYERKTSASGKAFFNSKAANSQVIGSSQMYASESSRDGGIASVKTNGSSKTVKVNT